jgi:hypothetical protein
LICGVKKKRIAREDAKAQRACPPRRAKSALISLRLCAFASKNKNSREAGKTQIYRRYGPKTKHPNLKGWDVRLISSYKTFPSLIKSE